MKYLYLLASSLLLIGTTYAQCDEKGITTNPDAPNNPEKPEKEGLYFDWRWEEYVTNSISLPSPVSSPFYQSQNPIVSHLVLNKDMRPEDGWELVAFEFGMNDDGTPASVKIGNTVNMVLYNRYTSILRVLVAGQGIDDYNGAEIKITFNGTTQHYSSVLSNVSEIFSLDEFESDPEGVSACRYINDDTGQWMYADFFMAYDPCTCLYDSRLETVIHLIEEANIELTGAITGTVASIDNKAGEVKENGLSASKVIESGGKVAKSYKNANKFVKDQKEALKHAGMTDAEIFRFEDNTLTPFQELLESSSFLKEGLKAVPYVNTALTMVDLFTGGGKTGPQEVKVAPMAINADVNLSGTIYAQFPYNGVIFSTPGSLNATSANDDWYPYYNEVLGVFNLIETPKLYFQDNYWTQEYYNEKKYKIKGSDVKYVINDAAGFSDDYEIMAYVEFDFEAGFAEYHNVFKQPDVASNLRGNYVSPLLPLSAMDDIEFAFFNTHVPSWPFFPYFNGAKLHILANFKREDATGNTQNVLHKMAFPLEIVESAPPQGWGNQFPQDHIEREVELSGNLSEDVYAWDIVRITGTVVNFTGQPITINAPRIIVGDNANVNGEIILNGGWLSQFPDVPPVPENEVIAFCNSSVYKDARVYAWPPAEPNGPVKTAKLTLTAAPNPFSTATELRYELPAAGYVALFVSDLMGQRVATLVDGRQAAGPQTATFRPQGARRGLYVATLRTDRGVGTRLIELR